MAAIQLGIGQSITSLVGKPKRDLLLQDFSIVETVQFPRSVCRHFLVFVLVWWYGDGAGNTVEEKYGVFSVIQMH